MSEPAVSDSRTPTAKAGIVCDSRNRQDIVSQNKPRRRYIKVDVPEEVFVHVHDMANQSRMRLLPYLRRFLEEAWPYPNPGDRPELPSFSPERSSPRRKP